MKKFARLIAAVAFVGALAAPSWGADCHDVRFDAVNTAVDPLLPFGMYQGVAHISIDGGPAIAAALSLVPGTFKFGDDGTVQPTGTLTFDLGAMGTLSVQDNGVLSPTANPYVYTMSSRLDNLAGTGMFAGAVGRLTDHGEFSFATLTITAQARGKVCW